MVAVIVVLPGRLLDHRRLGGVEIAAMLALLVTTP